MRKAIKKYRVLLCMELLIFALLLLGCFQKDERVYSDEELVMGAETGVGVYEGRRFAVIPGVYQVRTHVRDMQGESLWVSAACEQSGFRAFRCNGANIYQGNHYIDFEIYVLEKIDSAYVNCSFDGAKVAIDYLEVYRTNMGATMLLFLYTVVCLALNFMLLFREGILDGSITKEKQVVFWTLLISVLLAYYPYMTDYSHSVTDDGLFHWLRIEGLKETLMQGNQFPVRVQSYWVYDHGYAVSTFYGDLFLLIPVMLRFLGFSIMSADKIFVLVVMTATAMIAYYSFKQCTKHVYAALFGSVIYMLAPYRIYNFYSRAALGEYLAMTFLPLVVCGMYRLYTEDVTDKNYRTAKIPLIIGLSCILQSHILSSEMTVVFMLAVCVIFIKKTLRKETFVQLLQAAVIVLLLNAWFWFPLLRMMPSDDYNMYNVISDNIQDWGTWLSGLFQFYPNKGDAGPGMNMVRPFQMGITSFLILGMVLIVLVRKQICQKGRKMQNPYDRIMLFWSVLIIISWFMSTRYFPWDSLAGISAISIFVNALQFPTRLFSLICVFAAIMAAHFVLWFDWECKENIADEALRVMVKKGSVAVLLILAIGSAVYHVNDIAYESKPLWLHNAENMGTISTGRGEYLLGESTLDKYYYHDPIAEEGLEWSMYEKQGTSIWLSVRNTTAEELLVELPLTGYKGYALECSEYGAALPYITEERGDHEDLRIAVPAGYEGSMKVSYQGFTGFRIAELISAVTVIGIVLYWITKRRLLCKS